MNYKFKKPIFRVWLAVIVILLGYLMINYGDYKEYSLNCFDTKCLYNQTFFEDKYILESTLWNDSEEINIYGINTNTGILNSGESITFSNYEKRPFLVKYFLQFIIYSLMLCFGLNHLWYKKYGKNKDNCENN